MVTRRLLLSQSLLVLGGCTFFKSDRQITLSKLLIGIVSYEEGDRSIEKYSKLINYLETETKSVIQLEPAFNEIKAVERIQTASWDLVFAPPGLAAIAINKARYSPLFPLQGVSALQPILVVLKQSKINQISDLTNQKVALGQPGSATGYYVPLYNLYGLTLAETILAATPQRILELIAKGEVAAGALSQAEFDRYRSQFKDTEFRIIHRGARVPAGAVAIGPNVERHQKELITAAMTNVSPDLAQETGYIPNAKVPDYTMLMRMIERVKSIEVQIKEKPARLVSS
ncbi:MAG TPA: PhnD/SsuA/transferrin family substrate-binding protein [Leptolyngbyaceae cyanobacterium]